MKKLAIPAFLSAFGLILATSRAATLVNGYTTGTGSQLLVANGGAGSVLFEDNGVTGGTDLPFGVGATTGYNYVINAGSNWAVTDTVNLTGLSIPIWTNGTTSTSNNTSVPATFTFTFYSSGANNDWEGDSNLGTSDDSLIGSVTASFTGTAVSAFYVNFDTPITWSADSTQISFNVQSTGSMRLKTGNGNTLADNRSNGSAIAGRAASLAGTVTPVPEPSVALVGMTGLLGLFRRRRS